MSEILTHHTAYLWKVPEHLSERYVLKQLRHAVQSCLPARDWCTIEEYDGNITFLTKDNVKVNIMAKLDMFGPKVIGIDTEEGEYGY
jgi:hypothetical protein